MRSRVFGQAPKLTLLLSGLDWFGFGFEVLILMENHTLTSKRLLQITNSCGTCLNIETLNYVKFSRRKHDSPHCLGNLSCQVKTPKAPIPNYLSKRHNMGN